MKFKEKLEISTKLPSRILPSSYQIIGDVLLLKLPKVKKIKDKGKVAVACMRLLPYVKTVCEIGNVSGEFRKPIVRKLAGKSTETIHRESGIIYKIDTAKTMFSKGNHSERKRLLEKIGPNEVIVDMFAGIGYFSIPLSKFSPAKKIYSIEKNRASFEYLKENLQLNKVSSIELIFGDCRKIKLPEKADRIIMGYLPKTYKYLPAAFGFLKDKGVIHYHDTFEKGELWEKPEKLLKSEASNAGFKLAKVLERKIVKDYAPNVYHVVVDAEFTKKSSVFSPGSSED